jgi:hypothetical protein
MARLRTVRFAGRASEDGCHFPPDSFALSSKASAPSICYSISKYWFCLNLNIDKDDQK